MSFESRLRWARAWMLASLILSAAGVVIERGEGRWLFATAVLASLMGGLFVPLSDLDKLKPRRPFGWAVVAAAIALAARIAVGLVRGFEDKLFETLFFGAAAIFFVRIGFWIIRQTDGPSCGEARSS